MLYKVFIHTYIYDIYTLFIAPRSAAAAAALLLLLHLLLLLLLQPPPPPQQAVEAPQEAP
jgi:hypothetical protein